MTERKIAEDQLARALEVERDAAQRLRALDEMKNTFLQAVSHDLRTPLAAILGLAVTLERGDVELDAGDTQDLAGRIAENARKLERLVIDLLDMDRLARGIVSPKLERVDVGEVVRRVVIESEHIERSQMTMDLHPVVIPVDASKIERIVENLLANTARHTPSHAHVWVSVHRLEDGALIKVEDSGVGVPAELRESLFEPFQQGPERPATLTRSRGRPDARATVRRAARRPRVDRGPRGRRCVLPGVPARLAADPGDRLNEKVRARATRRRSDGRRPAGPTCAAPPGDPRPLTFASKNSALIGVNCFHSAGTSSS